MCQLWSQVETDKNILILFLFYYSWNCWRRFRFQAVVFSPPGFIAGYIRRTQTWILQEYEILNAQQQVLFFACALGAFDLN